MFIITEFLEVSALYDLNINTFFNAQIAKVSLTSIPQVVDIFSK